MATAILFLCKDAGQTERARFTTINSPVGRGYIYSRRLDNRGLAQPPTRVILKDNSFRAH
jgi:hypothetical protein